MGIAYFTGGTVLVSVCIYLFYRTLREIYRVVLIPPRKGLRKTPADFGMDYHEFQTLTRDRKKIVGWLINSPCPSRGTLILCHNMGGSKEKMLPYARFLHRAGYRTVLFDFRSHGSSDKSYAIFHALQRRTRDIESVWQYITGQTDTAQGYGIMGFSLGTVNSILFANACPNIKTIILDSGPPLFTDKDYQSFFKRGVRLPYYPYYPIFKLMFRLMTGFDYTSMIKREIGKLSPKALLMIHGLRDSIFSSKDTMSLYRDCAFVPKMYWSVPNAFHMTAHFSNRKAYENRVLDFLKAHLELDSQEQFSLIREQNG